MGVLVAVGVMVGEGVPEGVTDAKGSGLLTTVGGAEGVSTE
jgi:hypothetical protein